MAVRMRYGTTAETKKKTATGAEPTPVETQTLLWENPNPSTNFNSGNKTFITPISSGLVPLYDKLKIIYKRTSTGSSVYEYVIDMPASLNDYVKDKNKQVFVYGFETSDYYSCRYIQFVNDNTWWVSTGYRSNNTSGISTHNVITHLYGIKTTYQ